MHLGDAIKGNTAAPQGCDRDSHNDWPGANTLTSPAWQTGEREKTRKNRKNFIRLMCCMSHQRQAQSVTSKCENPKQNSRCSCPGYGCIYVDIASMSHSCTRTQAEQETCVCVCVRLSFSYNFTRVVVTATCLLLALSLRVCVCVCCQSCIFVISQHLSDSQCNAKWPPGLPPSCQPVWKATLLSASYFW